MVCFFVQTLFIKFSGDRRVSELTSLELITASAISKMTASMMAYPHEGREIPLNILNPQFCGRDFNFNTDLIRTVIRYEELLIIINKTGNC